MGRGQGGHVTLSHANSDGAEDQSNTTWSVQCWDSLDQVDHLILLPERALTMDSQWLQADLADIWAQSVTVGPSRDAHQCPPPPPRRRRSVDVALTQLSPPHSSSFLLHCPFTCKLGFNSTLSFRQFFFFFSWRFFLRSIIWFLNVNICQHFSFFSF